MTAGTAAGVAANLRQDRIRVIHATVSTPVSVATVHRRSSDPVRVLLVALKADLDVEISQWQTSKARELIGEAAKQCAHFAASVCSNAR